MTPHAVFSQYNASCCSFPTCPFPRANHASPRALQPSAYPFSHANLYHLSASPHFDGSDSAPLHHFSPISQAFAHPPSSPKLHAFAYHSLAFPNDRPSSLFPRAMYLLTIRRFRSNARSTLCCSSPSRSDFNALSN
ncbi:hypothetical protein L6R29_11835, partial [Myxococcota bacterium]|nr:hypothetical protein [Myxococcota bacterium]